MTAIPNSTRVKVELLIDVGPNATSREPHLHVGELLRHAILASEIYLHDDTLDFPLESVIVKQVTVSEVPEVTVPQELLKDSVDVHVTLAIGSMVGPARRTPESIVRIVRESLVNNDSVLGFKGDFTDESRGIIVSSITVGEVQDLPEATEVSVSPPTLPLVDLHTKIVIRLGRSLPPESVRSRAMLLLSEWLDGAGIPDRRTASPSFLSIQDSITHDGVSAEVAFLDTSDPFSMDSVHLSINLKTFSPTNLKNTVDMLHELIRCQLVDNFHLDNKSPAMVTNGPPILDSRTICILDSIVTQVVFPASPDTPGFTVSSIFNKPHDDTQEPVPTQPSVPPPSVSSTPSLELIELTIKLQIGKNIHVSAFLDSISEKLRAATTAAAKLSREEAWMVKCNIGKREWLGTDRGYRVCDVAVSAWIELGRPISTYDRQQLARSVILHLIDNSNNTIWELAFAVDTNNIVTVINVNANLGDGTVTPINIDVKPTPTSPPADFDWRDTSKSLPPNSVRVLTKTNEAPGITILTRFEKFWFHNDVYVFYIPDYWAPLPAADSPQ